MKLLLIVMGALVGLILLVVGVGILLPKRHIASRSAAFNVKPEQLFALIDGPQTWRSNVKKYEPTSSPDGHRHWLETDAHGQTVAYEQVERHPPTLLKARIATANLPYSGTWTFNLEPNGGSTVLRITNKARYITLCSDSCRDS
jgi:hypothetical protein